MSNYSLWAYRRDILKELIFGLNNGQDGDSQNPKCQHLLKDEIQWLAEVVEENPKNYQVWFHRQQLLAWQKDASAEMDFINAMLDQDSKNYHAWQHRQWVVSHFKLWESELDDCDRLLQEDVRNNSAWNHRFFVLKHTSQMDLKTREREIAYAFEKIHVTPSNEAAWNYALGVAKYNITEDASTAATLLAFLQEKTEQLLERSPFNVFGCSTLLYIMEHKTPLQMEHLNKANDLCDTLISSDSIRKSYWTFRKEQILDWKKKLTEMA